LEATRIQRERQQGLGKPIISANFKGERFVAVKNRLFHSDRFKTFHDFLVRYAMTALGPAWGTTELGKPEPERHPIALWYQALCRHQRKYMNVSGNVVSIPYSAQRPSCTLLTICTRSTTMPSYRSVCSLVSSIHRLFPARGMRPTSPPLSFVPVRPRFRERARRQHDPLRIHGYTPGNAQEILSGG
jgi:hypothetical protein